MPELPEVETVRRLLEPIVKGRRISNVRVNYWRMIQSDHDAFVDTLLGRTFKSIGRVGKFLIFKFDTDLMLISHLRMEGKYIELANHEPDSHYARVVFDFTDGGKLCYDDSRCFGTMQLSNTDEYIQNTSLNNVGPEPFDIESAQYLHEIYTKSSRPIKELLLDQTIMTGLGNIYADEVLFLSQVHPELPGKLLSLSEAKRLLINAREVLKKAIEAGGSTIRTYHAAKGVDGKFQHQLYAYDRAGQPCVRCQTPLVKIKVKGRGSTYCPRCQINRALPIVIAITGAMHAGKSTLMKIASNMGYPTLSSDDIVRRIYAQKPSVQKLEQILKISFPNQQVDSSLIMSAILSDSKVKRRLEKWIHPLVKQETLAWIGNQSSSHVFIEVPLLYEAKWEYLALYVIGVSVPYDIQKDRIYRNFKHPDLAFALAQTNQFAVYQNRVDDLLVNNVTLEKFQAMALEAVKKALAVSVKIAQSANF
ncbi:MAG TPA: bifunctional DNA-formamidopyrimidine glycosylase/DNA-(apurinic or apyrimidinic site) lyase [Bacilli bacterium]|nr:bifunctional DNA-formamidopyrimidine glycosylase/DNA-(apurinic or apyrimidinic site) lyase [Bacilli bacterium]